MMTNLALLLLCSVHSAATSPPNASESKCWIVRGSTQLVQVDTFGSDSLRVRATHLNGTIRDDLPGAFVPASELPFEVATDCTESKGETLINGNLNLTFTAEGSMVFTRVSDGAVLLEEERVRTIKTANASFGPGLWELLLHFKAYDGERLYGLGQHPHGFLDNKGQVLDLNQRNTQINIPLLHSNRGYSYLFNSPAFGNVSLSTASTVWYANAVFQLDLWICTTAALSTDTDDQHELGKKVTPLADRLAKYVTVTGTAPTFPYWSSGFWQVRSFLRFIFTTPYYGIPSRSPTFILTYIWTTLNGRG
jgi:alpha-D-xyloside xylohydrolase